MNHAKTATNETEKSKPEYIYPIFIISNLIL